METQLGSGRVSIIDATPDIWEAWRELRLRALKEEPDAFGASYEDELHTKEAEWRRRLEERYCSLAAYLGDTIVGMIGARRSQHPKMKHVAHVYGTYVVPEARGKGVGKALLRELLSRLKSDDSMIKISLGVNVNRTPAIKAYEDAGFRIIATLEKELHVGDTYIDVYSMEKLLR